MASGSQTLTTYYAKRIIGDSAAETATAALLQTGTDITSDTWILHRTNRASTYGIKYVYDSTTTTVDDVAVNNGHDKIELYGGKKESDTDVPTFWVQLDTGNTSIGGTITSTGSITATAGHIIAGTYTANTAQSGEYQVQACSGAGKLYIYSEAAITGNRGLYGLNSAGTAKAYLTIDKDNNMTVFGAKTWSNKVCIYDNYTRFYSATHDSTTSYGYIQCNADRMYFRKENGVSSYHFDFNGHLYTTGSYYGYGTAPSLLLFNSDIADNQSATNGLTANRSMGVNFYGKTSTMWYGDMIQGYTQSSGQIYMRMYLRNYKTDGTQVNNYIIMYANKDGTTSYDVANASAFRSAIGAGTSSLTIGTTATTAAAGNHTHQYLVELLSNNVSDYAQYKLTGTKGGYYGFLLGTQATSLALMATNSGGGFFSQGKRWVFYYDITNDRIAIGNSSPQSGYIVTLSGASYLNGNTYVNGTITGTNSLTLSSGSITAQAGHVVAGKYAANTAQSGEYQVQACSGAGKLYIYSQAATTGNRGLYGTNASGTNSAFLTINSSNQMTVYGTAVWGGQLLVNSNWLGFYASALSSTTRYGYIQCNADRMYFRKENGVSTYHFDMNGGYLLTSRCYNAVWNDYAECRKTDIEDPGYCITETNSGIMTKTTKRLQAGCKIISDTYGTCIGATDTIKTPIAVSGRVLVYPYRAREEYPLGAAVCSAPGGTVDIMTRDEIMMYPERIVGTVSEIPDYDIWHCGSKDLPEEVKVNGRIWIYVK